jgi:serine/threonine-protein kinase
MSVVFLAERADDAFERQVAIKVLPRGLNPEARRRLIAERRILARLEHPLIAGLLDGGTTADGAPYLVVELVAGKPITEYSCQAGLPLEGRLRLMCDVCEAVLVAHRQLIVHRDLKPSNVLVTDEGRVKLLDFGIAKILDPRRFGREGDATTPGLRLLTPSYASPEQLAGDDVTTATDVYALGILLFELIAGRPLFDFSWYSAEEALAQQRRGLPGFAQRGQGDARSVPRDVESIVARALAFDPLQRYPSPADLRDDLLRFLSGRPVSARSPSPVYRASRFVARHRWLVAVAAITLLALVTTTTMASLSAWRLAREKTLVEAERDRTHQVLDALTDSFEALDPEESNVDREAARRLLERAEARMPEIEDATALSQLVVTLGEIYEELGFFDRAAEQAARAVDLSRLSHSDRAPLVRSLLLQSRVSSRLGRPRLAMGQAREATRLARRLDTTDQLVACLDRLAWSQQDVADFEGAFASLREASRLARQGSSSSGVVAVSLLIREAQLETKFARPERVLDLAAQAIELAEVEGDRTALATAREMRMQGLFLRDDVAAALEEAKEVLAIRRQVFGHEHPKVARSLGHVASFSSVLGRRREAAALYEQTLAMNRKTLPPDHPELALTLGNYSLLLAELGRFEEAEQAELEALRIRRVAYGGDHHLIASSLLNLGSQMLQAGKPEEARRWLEESLAMHRRLFGQPHPRIALSLAYLGRAYLAADDLEAAADAIDEALAVGTLAFDPDHGDFTILLRAQAALLVRRGEFLEAERALDQATALCQRRLEADDARTLEVEIDSATLLVARGRAHEGRLLARQVLARALPALDREHPLVLRAAEVAGRDVP